MIVDIIHILVVGIVVGKSAQVLLAQRKVIQLVFENHTGMMQAVGYDVVALRYLLWSERNLLQIVFAFVRIVLYTVRNLDQRVLQLLGSENGIALLIGQFLDIGSRTHRSNNGLIDSLPVVDVLAFAPLSLESCFTLIHRHLVIKVPKSLFLLIAGGCCRCVIDVSAVLRLCFLGLGLCLQLPFLPFFLLQCVDNAVDSLVAFLLRHGRESLQRVLQINRIGIWHQLVEYL